MMKTSARAKLARKEKQKADEERIYVIVASSVTVDDEKIYLSHGRMAAQACHVTGKLRTHLAQCNQPYQEYTTIVLEARNSKELTKVIGDLGGLSDVYVYRDKDEDFYGTPARVMTAVCTRPVKQANVDDAIGHLEKM